MEMISRQDGDEELYRKHLLSLPEIAVGVYPGGLTDDQLEKLHSESILRSKMFSDMEKRELEAIYQSKIALLKGSRDEDIMIQNIQIDVPSVDSDVESVD
ncbi:hypothetical protein IFR05_009552 [Cadophora sp. M221]|nr:hypothetical protein IFR05_009552 [Cadophora sp. M221]